MKQLAAAGITLAVIVAGVVLATSFTSSAQEGTVPDPTTTTVADSDAPEPGTGFEFHFDGEFPAAVEEFLQCLRDEGIEVPETDGLSRFDLRSADIEGLAAAVEACGLPFGDMGPLGGSGGRFPFGDLPEAFPFGDGFEFGGGVFGIDRDALAACLAELGSFDTVDQVRERLDECLPAAPESLPGLDGFQGHGPFGFFGFGLEEDLLPGTST